MEKIEIVSRANREKVIQNPTIKELLLATSNKFLSNMDSRDNLFGLAKGNGRNELGIILMKLRAELKDINFILPTKVLRKNRIDFYGPNDPYHEFSISYLAKFIIDGVAYQSILQYLISQYFSHVSIHEFLERSNESEDWRLKFVMRLREILAEETPDVIENSVSNSNNNLKQQWKTDQWVDVKYTDGWYCARIKNVEFIDNEWKYLVSYLDPNEDDDWIPNNDISISEVRSCRQTINHKRSAAVSVYSNNTYSFLNFRDNNTVFPNYFEPFEHEGVNYCSILHLALMLIAINRGTLADARKLLRVKSIHEVETLETTMIQNWNAREQDLLQQAYIIKAKHNSKFRESILKLEADKIIVLGLDRLTTGVINEIADKRRWIYPNILGKIIAKVRQSISTNSYRKLDPIRKRTKCIEIEKIISHRIVNSELKFVVKYSNLSDRYNKEVPQDQIPHELFNQYASAHGLDA
jgi:predicted NAD-dependent protein-ADP-ribosyltransferase YbiA (DUF1768 family)